MTGFFVLNDQREAPVDQAVRADGSRQWFAVGGIGGRDKERFLIAQSAWSPCGWVWGVKSGMSQGTVLSIEEVVGDGMRGAGVG